MKDSGAAKARQRRDLALGPPCASTLGAKPCKPMLGKPTVATVPPNFTPRLAATGNAENLFSAFNSVRSITLTVVSIVHAE